MSTEYAARTTRLAARADGPEPYTAARLADARANGEMVFVNMTADWCITCLVNERLVLASEAVRARLAAPDVRYLEGDWTRRDPAITAFLAQFGRSGVPLYVVYRPGEEPRVLPQVLTQATVIDALPGAIGPGPAAAVGWQGASSAGAPPEDTGVRAGSPRGQRP